MILPQFVSLLCKSSIQAVFYYFFYTMSELEPEQPNLHPNIEPKAESSDGDDNPNSWLAGFVDILTDPTALALRLVRFPARIIAFASLLITFVSVGASYVYSTNGGISEQMYKMQAETVERVMRKQGVADGQIEQELDKIRERLQFSFVRTMGISIIYVMISLFLFGFLFWMLQRLFNSEPPPVLIVIGLANYGASISALGIIATCLMQFASNSLMISLSPTAFMSLENMTNPAMVQFWARLNPFTIWEYVVVGIVVARHVGMSRTQGIGIGATALVIVLSFTGAFAWMSGKLVG
jgi:hypothetical protein